MKPDLRFSNEYFFRGFRKESVRFLNIPQDHRAGASSGFLSFFLFFSRKGRRKKGKKKEEERKSTLCIY